MDAKASLDGSPVPAGPRTHATGGLGSAPGTGALGTRFTPSVPLQDLSRDPLIANAPWVMVEGQSRPTLGGIPLLAKLGQGGMGAVYYGIHPRLKTEVAVKVLPFHLAEQNPEMVQRFLREAEAAVRARSPHVVNVTEVNEESGIHYLVMEFVKGQTAGGYLRKVKGTGCAGLAEADALDICIAGSEGLAVAHEEGIIHRDIKPDNILIPFDQSGQPKLAASKLSDLGLARGGGHGDSITLSQVAMGTPGYMAPEQAADAKKARKPADVFSMGATLYALLSGNAPFQGSALLKILQATIEQPHRPIRELRPEVSTATVQLLDRCLAKKPEERYSDGHALLAGLKACRASLECGGLPPPSMRGQGAALQNVEQAVQPAARGVHPQPEPVPQSAGLRGLQFGKMQYIAIAVASLLVLSLVAGKLQQPSRDREGPETQSASRKPQAAGEPVRQAADADAKKKAEAAEKTVPAKALSLDLGNTVKLALILLPAGKFLMGSPETEKDRLPAETQHEVTISQPFYMGKYEVTQEQYEAVMGNNPSELKGPKNPVEAVSWEDGQEFCKKLSAKTGMTIQLPTEAQWEYACRAGTKTRFHSGDEEGDLDSVGWYSGNADKKAHPVGEKKSNAWGLYDIHGNVWEWCADWYGEYQAGAATDPTGPATGNLRVLRGGSWRSGPRNCRAAFRNWSRPDQRHVSVGFRVVVAPEPR
ncbi:MAG: bifunctional serine/threonine-protein kinase/formylglycine-generating enzyme family protein [Planctomycetota bacterium]